MARSPQKKSKQRNRKHEEPETPTVDERNLVDAEESSPQGDFEAKARAFWEKYQSPLLAALVVVALVIVVSQGVRLLREQAEERRAEAYARVAAEDEGLENFAENNETAALGGLAFLQLAHEAYASGNFGTAVENYRKAAEALQEEPLYGRARIGRGLAQIQEGAGEAGIATLESVANNRTLANADRTEALYHLAILALKNEEPEKFHTYFEEMTMITAVGPWVRRARFYEEQLRAEEANRASQGEG